MSGNYVEAQMYEDVCRQRDKLEQENARLKEANKSYKKTIITFKKALDSERNNWEELGVKIVEAIKYIQNNPSDDEYRDCCKVNAYKAVSELRKRLEGGE